MKIPAGLKVPLLVFGLQAGMLSSLLLIFLVLVPR